MLGEIIIIPKIRDWMYFAFVKFSLVCKMSGHVQVSNPCLIQYRPVEVIIEQHHQDPKIIKYFLVQCNLF